MAVNVSQEQLADLKAFFDDEDVKLGFSLNPVANGVTPGSAGIRCVNDRFGGLNFDSAANKQSTGILDEAVLGSSIVLSLAKDSPGASASVGLGTLLTRAGVNAEQKARSNLFKTVADALTDSLQFVVNQSVPEDGQHANVESRNLVWLTVGQTISVETVLSFTTDLKSNQALDSIKQAIAKETGFSLGNVQPPALMIERSSRGVKVFSKPPDGAVTSFWQIGSTFRITLRFAIADAFIFWISLGPRGVDLSVTRDTSSTLSPDSIWSKVDGFGGDGLSSSVLKPAASFLSSNVQLLRLEIGYDAASKVCWNVAVAVSLLPADGDRDGVDIFLTYDSLSKTFSGGLILAGFYAEPLDTFSPSYLLGHDIDLPSGKTYPEALDLRQFLSDPDSVPNNLPTAIAAASISFQNANPKSLYFRASCVNPPSPDEDNSVPSPFVWEELDLSLMKSTSSFSLALSTIFVLQQKDCDPAELGLTFEYNSGSWLLHGYAEDLSCGLLYSFFEDGSKDAMLDVLGQLNIESLDLLYTYDKLGASASFLFTGIITFGELQMRLFYQFTSSRAGTNQAVKDVLDNSDPKLKGPPLMVAPDAPQEPKPPNAVVTSWIFECDLGSSSGKATIGTVANSIIPDAASTLPAFIANIEVPEADGTTDRTPIYLKVTKNPKKKVLFGFKFKLGIFTFTFAQIADTSTTTKRPTKRLLRFSIDKIPVMQGVPLLGQLPQPFDHLEYLWVSGAGGFTLSEVNDINDDVTGVLAGTDSLMFKAAVKTEATRDEQPSQARPAPNADPTVLAEGHHFIVIQTGKVVIDHLFFTSPAPSAPVGKGAPPVRGAIVGGRGLAVGSAVGANAGSGRQLEGGSSVVPAGNAGVNQTTTTPSPPAKGTVSLKLGPLSIDSVALQFKQKGDTKALVITMDATLTMGPITFSLLGFGLVLTLSEGVTLDHIQDAVNDVDVTLEGLAMGFNKPPLLIAGGFQHQRIITAAQTQDIYLGGVGISFPPYTFVGVGEYATIELPTGSGNEYKSVFLFAKLDGPLVTLELATISGVRLGFGYNSYVRPPSIEQITEFPFINDNSINGVGNDPMALLKSFVNAKSATTPAWVSPKLDSYWFAAGMTITAFDVLTVTAVAMLAFRDSGLVASIYADAIAQMPPKAPKEAVIVYVEIGMLAEMNFIDGYFRVEAAIAPTSYLLVPQCRVYGGFAFCYWFAPSAQSGDFVFSIGGYHRSYTPPPWYPKPKRLGISFNIDIISIVGEAYFAVTPKCAMGGAMIHASLSFGPISAWLDATFDALVQFHPLHYTADFKVSVGVVFDADILFIHIHISISVGASLHIEGPEFGGSAYVDFYLFGFTVDFGARPKQPDPLDLFQFWQLLHTPGPEASENKESPVRSFLTYNFVSRDEDSALPSPQNVSGAAFKYILENGNFPMPNKYDDSRTTPKSTGAGEMWFVKGGSLQFRIASDFAITDANIALGAETIKRMTEEAKKSNQPVPQGPFVRAFHNSNPVFSKPMHAQNPIASTLKVTVTYKNNDQIIDGWDEPVLVDKDVPTAIWDRYDPSADPRQRPQSLLNGDNATMKRSMSFLLKSPPPELCPPAEAEGFIPKFNATAASKLEIRDFRKDQKDGTGWFMVDSEPLQKRFLPQVLTATELLSTNQKRWNATRDAWNALQSKDSIVNDPTNGVLSLFAEKLQWDQKRPQTEVPSPDPTARMPWQLTGKLPTKLVKNLEKTYLDLPRMAIAAA